MSIRDTITQATAEGVRLNGAPPLHREAEVRKAIAAPRAIVLLRSAELADQMADGPGVATTAPPEEWAPAHLDALRGAHVAILDPDRAFAITAARSIGAAVATVWIIEDDPCTWLDRTREELQARIRETEPWTETEEPPAAPEARPEPLFDPKEVRFGRFLLSTPPERRWVIKDVLPAGVAGALAAMGGAGKSYLVNQLGFSVTTGVPFLGLPMGEPGGFLYLAAEDDEAELHRRGLTLLDHYEQVARRAGHSLDRDAIAKRFHVVSRVAADNLLTTAGRDGEAQRTGLGDRIIEAAKRIPDLRVIAVDPISRFRGGTANSEEHTTRFVEALEAIREATGATVLGLSHVSQAGIKEGGGAEIVRGSTALVDGLRWVATLQRMRKEKAGDFGVPEAEADRYLRLEIPKSNYAAPFPGIWLRRETGGVMVPVELEEVRATRQAKRAESSYLDVVERLQVLLREKGPMTRKKITTRYAGASGILGAGDHKVRSIIERAVQDGSLIEEPGVSGTELRPPSPDDE